MEANTLSLLTPSLPNAEPYLWYKSTYALTTSVPRGDCIAPLEYDNGLREKIQLS